MKTKRYRFSARIGDKEIHAFVPKESDEERALERLRRDDPLWSGEVTRHGLVDYYDKIFFEVKKSDG